MMRSSASRGCSPSSSPWSLPPAAVDQLRRRKRRSVRGFHSNSWASAARRPVPAQLLGFWLLHTANPDPGLALDGILNGKTQLTLTATTYRVESVNNNPRPRYPEAGAVVVNNTEIDFFSETSVIWVWSSASTRPSALALAATTFPRCGVAMLEDDELRSCLPGQPWSPS